MVVQGFDPEEYTRPTAPVKPTYPLNLKIPPISGLFVGAYCKDNLGSYTCPCHTGFIHDDFFESGIVLDYNKEGWDPRTSRHYYPDRFRIIFTRLFLEIPDKVNAYNDRYEFNDIDEIEWEWFPTICLDIDECKVGTDLVDTKDDDGKICPPNSDCFNTEGSYVCNCAKGPEYVDHQAGFCAAH